ncbi:glutamate ABC transporter substrate-binding protein [Kitasatospora herbaricolor]|uniref:transporter substrate-binding domain-containing protein n=1 Tax=Kitasatospora herbaricolor TaxID=68217 RepID=UPI00174CF082|nr:transporter substrate-binding domain-containing protein [Kitasatospora herbaricolor]MDQ0313434.1 glutamate transport system substrate-binding protein [Kitasatospora herbaricolor]GGV38985.1 glutamate ABC transporter substrate-binding protein [Kitasatospora herbaricolor]
MRGANRACLAGILSGTLLLSGCGGTPSIFDQDSVRIGTKNNQPGTSMETANHGWSGFDVSVGEALVRSKGNAGSVPHFGDVASDQREAVLVKGGEDLVIATYSITPERTDLVYFAGPYASTYQGFMVHTGDSWLNSLDDLRGRSVCSWGGTTSEKELLKQAPIKGFTVVDKIDAEACRLELEHRRVDAVSTDQLLLHGLTHAFPELMVVPDVTIGVPNVYGVGIKKERYEDCIRIRDFLKDYVFSTAWIQDFRTSLPDAGNPESYRPQRADIDALSCKALPHQNQ